MMVNLITNIINEFDPLDLIPYSPQDEYYNEIKEIDDFIKNHPHCDVDTLAYQIYDIFMSYLGSDIFTRSIDECKEVAQKILLKL